MTKPQPGSKVRKVDDPSYFGMFIRTDNNGCWLIEMADGERHWKLADGWFAPDDNDVVTITIPRWVAAAVASWNCIHGFPITGAITAAARESLGMS